MKVTATPLETNIAKFTGPFHDPIPLITMSIQLSQDDYEQIKCIDKSNLEVTISEKNNQPTDYEKLKSLLVKFGVGIEEDESSDTLKCE